MNYLDLTIEEMHQALLEGKVTPLELLQESLKRAKEEKDNSFEYISEKEAYLALEQLDKKDKNNLMWGIPFVIKDIFSTKDIPTTASSNILNGYTPVYSSEVYTRLINAGGIPIGKTTLDELAMGGEGVTGHKGRTYNPYDPSHKRMVGGSSCGSASTVASAIVPLGIGSDTGDSVRKPASYAGLVGIKPTWSRISRFGLFPLATCLDHVGYFTRSVADSALVLELLAGRDDKDSTSSDKPVGKYLSSLNSSVKGIKVAVIKEILDSLKDEFMKAKYNEILKALEDRGAIINYVSMDIRLCRSIYPTYMIISSSEATSNNACLDGIKYGPRYEGKTYEEVVIKARTNGFSYSIKKRFVYGSYFLESDNQKESLLKAQKCRRLIANRMNEILSENDVIFLPSTPSPAPLFDREIDKMSDEFLIADNYLASGNFAGLPSLTLPIGLEDGLPFGGNVTGRAFDEQTVLNVSLAVEEITGLKNLHAKRG